MPRVKEKRTKLERAAERADDYVAGELTSVMKDVRGIVKSSQDDRSRVAGAKLMLDWARPKKPMQFAMQVNVPQINSRLQLPTAPPSLQDARLLSGIPEVEKIPVQKVVPEPVRTIADSLRPFRKAEVLPAEVDDPGPLPELDPAPKRPKAPSARSVKPYDR